MARLWLFGAALLAAVLWSARPADAQTCDVKMLPGEVGLGMPVGQGMIKEMPDGNIWFGEATTIARADASPPYEIKKFTIGTPAGVTNDVAAGPGGYWFTEIMGNKIGRITPHDPYDILEIPLPPGATQPDSIVAGPDGHLWFTQWSGQIGRISPRPPYTIDQYPVPDGGVPREMVAGRDGVLWYTNPETNAIGRIAPQRGSEPPIIREFRVPTENARPVGLAEGTDGTIWFTELLTGGIGWFDPSTPEGMTEVALPSHSSAPVDIALGPDGDLWVTETGTNLIGRLRPGQLGQAPTLTECSVPETPYFVDVASDGAVWFTTFHNPGVRIGRISPDLATSGASPRGSPTSMPPPGDPTGSRVARLPRTGGLTSTTGASLALIGAGLLLTFLTRTCQPSNAVKREGRRPRARASAQSERHGPTGK